MVQKALYMSSMIGIAQTVSLSQEREYVFPQYTEIAPCPCDLSPGCDTYCCCDPSCPSDPPFPCLSGLPGGQPGGKLQDFNCSEPALPAAAAESPTLQLNNYLHPLLCIHSSNSPYLGHYHKPAPKLESHVKHEEVRKRKRSVRRSTYEEKGYGATSLGDSGNATLPYRRGLTVKTVYSVEEDITGVLSLPSPSLTSSHCSSQPIRFLKPTSHRCLSELSKQVMVQNIITIIKILIIMIDTHSDIINIYQHLLNNFCFLLSSVPLDHQMFITIIMCHDIIIKYIIWS